MRLTLWNPWWKKQTYFFIHIWWSNNYLKWRGAATWWTEITCHQTWVGSKWTPGDQLRVKGTIDKDDGKLRTQDEAAHQKNKPIFCSPSNTRIPVGVKPRLYSLPSRPCLHSSSSSSSSAAAALSYSFSPPVLSCQIQSF